MQTPLALILLLCGLLLMMPLVNMGYRKVKRKITYARILEEINILYNDANPFLISKTARLQQVPQFLYGEIEIPTLLDLMTLIRPLPHYHFYDLGSGCGKAALGVKMCYPALKVTGIEMIPALHELAVQKYQVYLEKSQLSSHTFEINFIQGDFLLQDFKDADIIFINATAFENATWQQILDKLDELKAGARIIITSKTLPEDVFCKKHQCMALMSWGFTSTYIYEKRN